MFVISIKKLYDYLGNKLDEPEYHKLQTEENPVDDFVCSKCGVHLHDWVKVDDEDWYEFEFKYCPNCGAEVVE